MAPMAIIDKSLTHGSQLLMRCSLQMVYIYIYQSTEELSIRTNLYQWYFDNGDHLPLVGMARVDWYLFVYIGHVWKDHL